MTAGGGATTHRRSGTRGLHREAVVYDGINMTGASWVINRDTEAADLTQAGMPGGGKLERQDQLQRLVVRAAVRMMRSASRPAPGRRRGRGPDHRACRLHLGAAGRPGCRRLDRRHAGALTPEQRRDLNAAAELRLVELRWARNIA